MGILSTIKELGLVRVQDVKSTYENHYIQYLDYVLVNPGIKFDINPATGVQTGLDKEKLVNDGLISISPEIPDEVKDYLNPAEEATSDVKDYLNPSGEFRTLADQLDSPAISQLSLVLNKVLVEFKNEELHVEAGDEPSRVVLEYLLKDIISNIKRLAEINKKEFLKEIETASVKRNEQITFSYDFEEIEPLDMKILRKKLMAKTLTYSSYISKKCRRGPANLIIANKRIIDLMEFPWSSESYVYAVEKRGDNVGGFKKFVCEDLGDTVIIGRLGNLNEPGLTLVSNDESLENNIFFNATDIAGINIRYALDSYSPSDKFSYLSFDFKLLKK